MAKKCSNGAVVACVAVLVSLLIAQGIMIALLLIEVKGFFNGAMNASAATHSQHEGDGSVQRIKEAPEDPTKPWSNIRLPTNLIPTSYNVSLRPVLEKDENGHYMLWGSSSVAFECKEPTEYIILHQNGINFRAPDVTVSMDRSVVEIISTMQQNSHQYVVLEMKTACKHGGIYDVKFKKFSIKLAEQASWGLYINEYKDENGSVSRVVASSQMQPTGARKVFPCFDEPAFKANFTITLWYKAESNHVPVSNMPTRISGTSQVIDGEVWNYTIFQPSFPVSTYLLAMVVGEYSWETRRSESGVEMKTYGSKAEVEKNEAEYAADISSQILDFYEDYFDFKYPLPKLDQIAVGRLAFGAMENWGLITYRDTILTLNKQSSVSDKLLSTLVISHELVHQWFGNLVTLEWWNELWLNEGFATYFSYIGLNKVQPSWKAMSRFLLDEFYPAMEHDLLPTTHPIVVNVSTPSEIWKIFDVISYMKGASILRMIRGFLGEDAFMAGLRSYLKELAYGTTTSEKLISYWELNEKSSKFNGSLSDILLGWLTTTGYPLVNVIRSAESNSYQISHETFSPYFEDRSQIVRSNWCVPFTYKVIESEQTELKWLSESSEVTISEPELILANVDSAGYYRVNYDVETWRNITQQLKEGNLEAISVENRAQLISDSFTMARAGRLDVTVPLELSEYLVRETEYVPWAIFVKEIIYFGDILESTKAEEDLSKFMLYLIDSLYKTYGWINETDMGDDEAINRLMIGLTVKTACKYGNKDCVQKAVRSYSDWMERGGDESGISEAYRAMVYCTAIRHGGLDEWTFAREQYNRTSSPEEKKKLLLGMSCTKDGWILARHIKEDSKLALRDAAGQKLGRLLGWSYLIDQYEDSERGVNLAYFPYIAYKFSTKSEMDALTDALNSGIKINGYKYVEKTVSNNIMWKEANEEKLMKWLQDKVRDQDMNS